MGVIWPRISIVVPSLDQGAFIEDTLRSVHDQGYPDVEVVVVDGGSTDGTAEILRRHAGRLAWWTSEPDEGQADAIAKGMAHTSGQLVNWLNADDLLRPGGLEAVARSFMDHGDGPAIFAGGADVVDAAGRTRYTSSPRRSAPLVPGGPPVVGGVQASWFLTRTAWEQLGGLDRDLRYAMDVDLYLRAAAAGIPIVPLDSVVAAYRDHPESKTATGWRASIDEKAAVYERALLARGLPVRRRDRNRIRKHCASLCLGTIRPQMGGWQRLQRAGAALRHWPWGPVRRERAVRMWRMVRHGTAEAHRH